VLNTQPATAHKKTRQKEEKKRGTDKKLRVFLIYQWCCCCVCLFCFVFCFVVQKKHNALIKSSREPICKKKQKQKKKHSLTTRTKKQKKKVQK
jgi:choline-glycine betaine transporter